MGKRITVIPGVFIVILFMVFLGLCSAVNAASLGYKEVLRKGDLTKIVLDNGLSAVLLENHAAPVAALQVWVNVGSRYEQDDQAGISHVFEHMLFKGTEKRGVGEIAREVETAGGDINAFTSFDHTV
jgi:predicted Zn-dependent peptidase